MRTPTSSCLSLLALTGLLAAQGTYATVGSPCSLPGKSVYSANPKGGTTSFTTLSNEYCYPVNKASTAVTVVTGVRFYTRSVTGTGTQTVGVRIYNQDPKSPGNPNPVALDTTKMTVGPVTQFYQASFNKVHIMRGQFWVSFDCVATFTKTTVGSPAVYATNLAGGSQVTPVYWRRPPVHDLTWSRTGIIKAPSYHILSGGGLAPVLSAAKGPTLGQPFQLDLAQSVPGKPTVAVFGFNNAQFGSFKLPLNLNAIAPGCFLLQSLDIILLGASLPGNKAKAILPIPNNTNLKGLKFYNQWMILVPGGNPLNWVFSNGGLGTIG